MEHVAPSTPQQREQSQVCGLAVWGLAEASGGLDRGSWGSRGVQSCRRGGRREELLGGFLLRPGPWGGRGGSAKGVPNAPVSRAKRTARPLRPATAPPPAAPSAAVPRRPALARARHPL